MPLDLALENTAYGPELITLLLNAGADATKAWLGLVVCRDYALELIPLLLKAGSNVNKKHIYGNTPLIKALMNHCGSDILTFLFKSGADVNKADNDGITPLMIAAYYGNDSTVTLLLENGARVDDVDNKDETALLHAARKGDLKILEILTNAGADIKLENNEGKTAESQSCNDKTHLFFRKLLSERNNSLMEKLKEFENLREQQLKKEYPSEKIAQKFANDISEITWKSSANNIQFLREHMDLLPINFKDVRNYLFDSADLLNLISADALPEEERDKFDTTVHAMRELATTLGHKDAKRIIDRYKKDKETSTPIQEEKEKPSKPSSDKLNIVALPSSTGMFSSEQKNARTNQSARSQEIDNSSNSSSASIGFRNTSSSSSQD